MNLQELSQKPFIKALIKQGARVYLVGGNVRDHFLGLQSKDHDLLISKLSFNTIKETLSPFGSANIVGKSFGILKFRASETPDFEYDFSLPRLEKSTGSGHRDFDVQFNPDIPIEDDLGRRDFTINAMAMSLKDKNLIDPFNGKADLDNKKLRIVFEKSFSEDPLRLLRAVQFAARFKLKIEESTLKSMQNEAQLINTVSKERVVEEIRKLFLAEKPSIGFDIMKDTGILKHLFPFIHEMIGIKQPMKNNEDVYQHTMKVLDASKSAIELEKAGDLDLMFAALFHDAGKPKTYAFDKEKNTVTFYGHQIVSKGIAKRWLNDHKARTAGVDIAKVLNLVVNHMFETKAYFSDKAIRRFIGKVGEKHIMDLIDLRIADKKGGRYPDSMKGILNLRSRIQDELDKEPPFSTKDLAISGHDIIKMGFKAGPIIGQINDFLIEKVLDDPSLNTKESLSQLIQENFS